MSEFFGIPTMPPPFDPGSVDGQRAIRLLTAQSRLVASDVWVVRAYEDGVQLSTARKAYRAALRTAIANLATATDPTKVALPDPPPPPTS